MSVKAGWRTPDEPEEPPALPPAVSAIVARAELLTAEEVRRLDDAERADHDVLLVAWDLLRDRLAANDADRQRRVARNAAWDAATSALTLIGLPPLADDGAYWRGITQPGAGAARAARYAACALLAPDQLEPEIGEILTRPWRSALGDVTGPERYVDGEVGDSRPADA